MYFICELEKTFIVVQAQSPLSPDYPPTAPLIPTSHTRSYLPLALSMCPLYMVLDDPSPIFQIIMIPLPQKLIYKLVI